MRPQTIDKPLHLCVNAEEKIQECTPQRGYQPLDVLHSRSQEALFPHVRNPEHARIAQAMVLFGLRKGAFNRFFPPAVNPLATMRFRKGNDSVQRSLPHMPLHHLSAHTRPKAFSSPCTPLAHPLQILLSQQYCRYPSRVVFFHVSRCFSGQMYSSRSAS